VEGGKTKERHGWNFSAPPARRSDSFASQKRRNVDSLERDDSYRDGLGPICHLRTRILRASRFSSHARRTLFSQPPCEYIFQKSGDGSARTEMPHAILFRILHSKQSWGHQRSGIISQPALPSQQQLPKTRQLRKIFHMGKLSFQRIPNVLVDAKTCEKRTRGEVRACCTFRFANVVPLFCTFRRYEGFQLRSGIT
jgi:hypothetical protein